MDYLWRPWRMEYILSEKPEGCIFCDKPKENRDKENYILYRGETCFSMLNIYPYNNGHLMVVPFRHVLDLDGLTDNELTELIQLVRRSMNVQRKALNPDGFNVGMNVGKVAGAGVKDHIHIHVVPRWGGDTNFMPLIADTRVIPELLQSTYEKLMAAL
ncbi:MAG TPA: HIT family hydrolase [Actinobacteria bacterium]|nr:HIT family hydrolase [Actinomycetota bacterium]